MAFDTITRNIKKSLKIGIFSTPKVRYWRPLPDPLSNITVNFAARPDRGRREELLDLPAFRRRRIQLHDRWLPSDVLETTNLALWTDIIQWTLIVSKHFARTLGHKPLIAEKAGPSLTPATSTYNELEYMRLTFHSRCIRGSSRWKGERRDGGPEYLFRRGWRGG